MSAATNKRNRMNGAGHGAFLDELGSKELAMVTVKRMVTDADAWNLLTSAFDGGSTYWCRLDNSRAFFEPGQEKPWTYYQDVLFLGGKLVIEQCGEDLGVYEPCPHELTRERCAIAFQLMAEKHERHFREVVEGNSDADTGDVFLQLAVLGEVVYG